MSISVVGGGPAGSTVAIFLVRSGFERITLYERSPNKRKPCGGGLTWRLFKRYNSLLKGIELNEFKNVLIDFDETVMKLNFKKPIIKIVDRLELDKHLRNIAESEGVKLVKRSVEPCELDDDIVVDARGIEFKQNNGIARVTLCKLKNSNLNFIFRSSLISKGYFWIFPINDEIVDVGCGGVLNSFKIPVNKAFEWFVKRIGAKPIINMGYPLNLSGRISNLIDKIGENFIVKVGERAGLVNPLTGEGIYYAIRSSEILSECIKEGNITSYKDEINREFKNEFMLSKFLLNFQTLLPNPLKVSLVKYLTKKFFPHVNIGGL